MGLGILPNCTRGVGNGEAEEERRERGLRGAERRAREGRVAEQRPARKRRHSPQKRLKEAISGCGQEDRNQRPTSVPDSKRWPSFSYSLSLSG